MVKAMIEALLLILALGGHATLWISLFNQGHARAFPRWVVRLSTLAIYAAFLVLPLLLAPWYLSGAAPLREAFAHKLSWQLLYIDLCWVMALASIVNWAVRLRCRPSNAQRSNHTTHVDLLEQLGAAYDGPAVGRLLSRLPGNQLLDLSIHDKELEIPRLPAELDGFSIVQVSDLHFTGSVGKSWFQEVIRRANALEGDLIAVTGDIVDRPHAFAWIPDTLGQLRAPLGVYYILGNHDRKVDAGQLRAMLAQERLINLGARWLELRIRGRRVVLAGNELPWFRPAADLAGAPARETDGEPLRIVLSHSPDQMQWARRHDVDLVLAGHTHGGQLRFPLVGPVVNASLAGGRYSAGTFYEPPTVMHVSRGLSSTVLFRLNCPPELTRLVLRCPRQKA